MTAVGIWAASYSPYLSQFGLIGWILAGLLAALFLVSVVFVSVLARNAWANGRRVRKWVENSDDFNPMGSEIRTKRILLSDLAHPVTRDIAKKKIYNCELIGPESIFIYKGCYFKDVTFFDCSVFVLWPDSDGKLFPGHSIIFKDVEMHGGSIYKATFLIPPQIVQTFFDMGIKFSTLTGRADIDIQLQKGTATGTPR